MPRGLHPLPKPVDLAPVAFRRPAFAHPLEPWHCPPLFRQFQARRYARLRFAVERASDHGRAARIAERHYLNFELAAIVSDPQLVAGSDVARGLDALPARLNSA